MSKYIVVLLLVLMFSMIGCIKDAPKNIEADILSFGFKEKPDMCVMPDKGLSKIVFETKEPGTGMLTPDITVSEGATIDPKSGVPQDFNNTVLYTVTSENRLWMHEYTVQVKVVNPLVCSFDEWESAGAGTIQYPVLNDYSWSSANPGVGTARAGKVTDYPARPTADAYRGTHAALLETQRGGRYFNVLVPIFPASLFRGKFSIDLSNFAKSVKFGQPHSMDLGRPVLFSGYFKYKAGSPFYDENDNIVPGRVDEGAVYSVLFKTAKGVAGTEKDEFLDGTNILTSDKIVAIAKIEHCTDTPEYTHFEIPFVYKEEINYDLFDYKLTVVLASSREGDFYRGAVGSTLTVDEVEVVCVDF
ncbi:MAG: PCMD domain-containing protein [Dysgonamonadaceae bacterium]|jgi:hypothetical protein|nr:PCMD domain-containing protein [Dysgonamonadaceae bacterium]